MEKMLLASLVDESSSLFNLLPRDDVNFYRLQIATDNNDLKTMQTILKRRLNIGARNRYGKILHGAVSKKNWKALELLLRHKVSPNVPDESGVAPLHLAVSLSYHEAIELLLKHGADPNVRDSDKKTPLHWTVKQRCPKMMRSLLENGADVNARDNISRTPLTDAVESDLPHLVHILLNYRADVNIADSKGWTPLHCIVVLGSEKRCEELPNFSIFDELLSYGADLQKRIRVTDETPLHLAVSCTPSFVKKLLDYGANVDATEAGARMTPLHLAMKFRGKIGSTKCINDLLVYGSDLRKCDAIGGTPLLYACQSFTSLQVVAEYLVRADTAGFRVDISYRVWSNKINWDEDDYRQCCIAEIVRMKELEICRDITYHDFILFSRTRLMSIAKNPKIAREISRSLKDNHFSLYNDFIERNYAVIKLYKDVKPATDTLNAILKYRLPSIPHEQIISYLKYSDLKNLIAASPTS